MIIQQSENGTTFENQLSKTLMTKYKIININLKQYNSCEKSTRVIFGNNITTKETKTKSMLKHTLQSCQVCFKVKEGVRNI